MKTYIWPSPVRLFHWLLAISFVSAFVLSDFEEHINWHFAFGAFVGVLLFFRVIFGFIGPRYARFKDFPVGVVHQIEFIKNFPKKTKTYAGHNPSASVVMMGIFVVGILCSMSGFLLHNAEINASASKGVLEEMHEIWAHLFLILVILHLVGLAADFVFHRKAQTIKSMVTGYKNLENGAEKVELSGVQKAFSVVWFIVPIIAFYLAHHLPVEHHKEKDSRHYEHHNSEHGDNEHNDND